MEISEICGRECGKGGDGWYSPAGEGGTRGAVDEDMEVASWAAAAFAESCGEGRTGNHCVLL